MSAILRERLITLIEPVLARMGYELVELEHVASRAHAVVRVFIDRPPHEPTSNAEQEPDGVGIDDCERVSHELSALLDVEDPIPSAYTLEVSSPGADRILRTRTHFDRFVGSRVFVELKAPREGRRRYTGTLRDVADEGIALEVDRQLVSVPFEEIGKARLAP